MATRRARSTRSIVDDFNETGYCKRESRLVLRSAEIKPTFSRSRSEDCDARTRARVTNTTHLYFPLRGLLSATGAGSRGSRWMEPRDRSRGRRGPARHRTRTRAIYGAPVHILHGLLSATGGEWEWGDSQRSLLSLKSLYHAAWAFVRRVRQGVW